MALSQTTRGYVEVTSAANVRRRHTIDFSFETNPAKLPFTPVRFAASGAPDLSVGVQILTFVTRTPTTQPRTQVKVFLRRESGGTPLSSVAVFLCTDPIAVNLADPTPTPTAFAFLGVRIGAGFGLPATTELLLDQRGLGTDDRVDIDVKVTQGATPSPGLWVFGGRLRGPVSLRPAKQSIMFGAGYLEQDVGNVRTLDPAVAPTATVAEITLHAPGAATVGNARVQVGIVSPHNGDRPAAAPNVALAGQGAGRVDAGTHRYQCTFVHANGNETSASPPSAPVQVTDPATNGRVRLTNLPIGPTTVAQNPDIADDPGLVVTKRRIYRTGASPDGDAGDYRLAAEINNTATTWVDGDPASTPPGRSDADLTTPPVDRLTITYGADRSYDLDGSILLRDLGVTDRYLAAIDAAPTSLTVTHRSPSPDPATPRVLWRANGPVSRARVVVPTLRGGPLTFAEVIVDGLPPTLGMTWNGFGAARRLIELSGTTRGAPLDSGTAIGRVRLLLRPLPTGIALPKRAGEIPTVMPTLPHDLTAEIVDRVGDGVAAHRTVVGGMGITQLRFATGTPRSWGSGFRFHAVDGDGLVVELHQTPIAADQRRRRDRSGRILVVSEEIVPGGSPALTHLELVAGSVPDHLVVDRRASTGVAVEGRLRWVRALVHGDRNAHPSGSDAGPGRYTVAIPDTQGSLNVDVRTVDTSANPLAHDTETTTVGLEAAGPIRVALTGRRSTPLTGVAADVIVPPSVTAELVMAKLTAGDPTASLTNLQFTTTEAGLGGRVGLEFGRCGYIAARAAPQVKLGRAWPIAPLNVNADHADDVDLASLTARWSGLLSAKAALGTGRFTGDIELAERRPNRSFSVRVLEDDALFVDLQIALAQRREAVYRFGTRVGRQMAKFRVSRVPEKLHVEADTEHSVFRYEASSGFGSGAVWAEPQQWKGSGAGRLPKGIGLVEAAFDDLPRAAGVALGSGMSKPVPENITIPGAWNAGGFELSSSGRLGLHFVRIISWAREDVTDEHVGFWTRADINKLIVVQQSPEAAGFPPRLDRMWLWQFGEANPSDIWSPEGGLGWDIDRQPGLRVDLDLDSYEKGTVPAGIRYWADLPEPWWLKAEVQMKDYSGVETLDSREGLSNPVDGLGPTNGKWFIRSVGAFLGSSVYFSNTGGIPTSRPRIWS